MLSKVSLRTDTGSLYSEEFWEDDDQIKSKSIYWTPSSSRRSSPANHLALSSNTRRSSRLRTSPGSLSRSSTSANYFGQLPLDQGSLSVCDPALATRYPTLLRSSPCSLASSAHKISPIPLFWNRDNLTAAMNPRYGDRHVENPLVVMKSLAPTIRNSWSRGKTQEIDILEFIASTKGLCPFLQGVRIRETFSDQGPSHIRLESYPTSLAHPHVARRFSVARNVIPGNEDYIQPLKLLSAELCLALLFLHRHGIVHQDVKPANIMISRDGHAVLGDFGAARLLSIANYPHYTSEERQQALSGQDTSNVEFESIVLQPDDVVTLTPAYASPELMERNSDGLLVYDERVDWWSLGVSLYEVVAGRMPFHTESESGLPEDVQHILDQEAKVIQEYNASLYDFLRMLLVHNPADRLSGDKVKLHQFFEFSQGLWEEIESLRHPPCPRPPNMSFFGVGSFDLESARSKIYFPNDNLSTRSPSSNTTPPDCDTPGVARGLNLSKNSQMPPYSINYRKEALEIGRPAPRIFEDRSTYLDSPTSYDSGGSIIVQQEAFMSSRFDSAPGLDTPNSSMQPFPSSASITRFFSKDDAKLAPSMELTSEEVFGHCTLILDNFDGSFNDSGLDFPLGESPESWGPRKDDEIRKPDRLRLAASTNEPIQIEDNRKEQSPTCLSLIDPKLPQIPLAEKVDDIWTLDQQIAISLLSAGVTKERLPSERQAKRRLGTVHFIAGASGRAIHAVMKRITNTLRCWQPDLFAA